MQKGFVDINSVPTHIFTWGQWVHDDFKRKELVIIITGRSTIFIIAMIFIYSFLGNPGLPGFYTTFAKTLYDESDKVLPVWIIGHAGHEEAKKELMISTPPLKGNEQLYNLKGQLDHKKDFISRFVPKDVKVFLIGHSIGSKFCLELLKESEFSTQVQHCYLLFPTIERMAESKKGVLVPTYDRFFFLFRIFYNLFALMPLKWKEAIVRRYCRKEGIHEEEFFEPSLGYTNPKVIDKIWFLALDEMEKVRELDEQVIKDNVHRLKLYYGTVDDWVPTEYHQEIKERIPEVEAELCKKGYEHAFVLKSGVEVGKMVFEWMSKVRKL